MTEAYLQFKLALLQLYPTCEICGLRQSTEVNHCLYHKHGGIFDTVENCQAVCVECHNRFGHSNQNKRRHWMKREGQYDMQKWNMKVSRFRREWWL